MVKATAAAIVVVSMAVPAYAHGNGNDRGKGHDKGRGHVSAALALFAGKHDKGHWFERITLDDCLKVALEARTAAIKAATKAHRTALSAAASTHHDAVKAAQKTRKEAVKSARATFRASAKAEADKTVFVAATAKAEADLAAALKAAKIAHEAAKDAAEAAWKAVKTKVDADVKAAKEQCGTAAVDTVSPAAPMLSLSAAGTNSVLLSWTAVGDDGAVGTAASYDIRYAKTAILTEADFAAATQVTGEPAPAVAGTSQSMTVSGLEANTAYHFAIKVKDEKGNASTLSVDVSLSTLADTIAPSALNLLLSAATANSILVSWNAVGDDGTVGTAASYDLRYSTTPIATEAAFDAATQVTGEPAPAVAGTAQSMTVTGLSGATTYHFGAKVKDDAANVSPLSNVPSLLTL